LSILHLPSLRKPCFVQFVDHLVKHAVRLVNDQSRPQPIKGGRVSRPT